MAKFCINYIFNNSVNKLEKLYSNYENFEFSIGDTPSSSVVNNYPKFISELRPGNFVFYDLSQYKIGSCKLKDISLRMVCPIVSIYPDRNQLLIYGGSVHFSKDYIIENGNKCYGYVYSNSNYWDMSNKIGYVKSLSQEHGIIKLSKTLNPIYVYEHYAKKK